MEIGMPAATRARAEHSSVRSLIIVARDCVDLFHTLQRELSDHPHIEILLDRRRRDRRTEDEEILLDRRRTERRAMPSPQQNLRTQRYLLTRPHHRRPSEIVSGTCDRAA